MRDRPAVLRLVGVDDDVLEDLLAAAVSDAEPTEVMPAVPGPPGWSPARREAFRAFHRARYAGFDGRPAELSFAIVVDDRVVGAVRLRRTDDPDSLETGMWLGRTARGHGHGAAVLRAVLAKAAELGAARLTADTTPDNQAAVSVLRRHGALLAEDRSTGAVRAVISIGGSD